MSRRRLRQAIVPQLLGGGPASRDARDDAASSPIVTTGVAM
jgi:hypothetical protein